MNNEPLYISSFFSVRQKQFFHFSLLKAYQHDFTFLKFKMPKLHVFEVKKTNQLSNSNFKLFEYEYLLTKKFCNNLFIFFIQFTKKKHFIFMLQLFVFSYQLISPGVWDCWATFTVPYGQEAYVTWLVAS